MVKVILACIHNAGRSQMAAAFFNQLADPDQAEAVSAGTEPGLRVHPEVLDAIQEVGIDLSGATPQKLTEELARDGQLLITMGCGDKWPYVCRASGEMPGRSVIPRASRWKRFAGSGRRSAAEWNRCLPQRTSRKVDEDREDEPHPRLNGHLVDAVSSLNADTFRGRSS